jgi:hypothetical protein
MDHMTARRQVLRERQHLDQMPEERRRDKCNIGHFVLFGGGRALYLPHSAAAGATHSSALFGATDISGSS